MDERREGRIEGGCLDANEAVFVLGMRDAGTWRVVEEVWETAVGFGDQSCDHQMKRGPGEGLLMWVVTP